MNLELPCAWRKLGRIQSWTVGVLGPGSEAAAAKERKQGSSEAGEKLRSRPRVLHPYQSSLKEVCTQPTEGFLFGVTQSVCRDSGS